MTEKKKRYYSVGEIVWLKTINKKVIVEHIDVLAKKVIVKDFSNDVTSLVNLWDIDKLKSFKETDFTQPLPSSIIAPTLYVAKVRDNAVIPQKDRENAGWDIIVGLPEKYKTVDGHLEMFIEKGDTALVPTGLAMAIDTNWAISLQHERGSVGSKGFLVGAGLVDSGYRGEVFASITATKYNLLLTTDADKVELSGFENDTLIYPISKPLVQAVIIQSPNTAVEELDLDTLQGIPSKRGTGSLGSTSLGSTSLGSTNKSY